jgi:hypothetical protein
MTTHAYKAVIRLNMLTLVLFAGAGAMLYARWSGRALVDYRAPLALGIVALALLLIAGVLGWRMMRTYYVGGDDSDPPRDSFADVSRATGPGLTIGASAPGGRRA